LFLASTATDIGPYLPGENMKAILIAMILGIIALASFIAVGSYMYTHPFKNKVVQEAEEAVQRKEREIRGEPEPLDDSGKSDTYYTQSQEADIHFIMQRTSMNRRMSDLSYDSNADNWHSLRKALGQ